MKYVTPVCVAINAFVLGSDLGRYEHLQWWDVFTIVGLILCLLHVYSGLLKE